MSPIRHLSMGLLFCVLGALAFSGCAKEDGFTRTSETQYIVQDYNPEVLDVLWMIDDRSTLSRRPEMRSHLIEQSRQFFVRLDKLTTSDYRMGFISGDMEYSAPGELKPKNAATILTKNVGSPDERAYYFGSIIGKIFNLQTSAINKGIENARQALYSTFQPRLNVPLVLVFISDSDEHSNVSLDFLVNEFRNLKQQRSDLLRVYSVNYTVNGPRCATVYNADIDKAGFQDRFNELARRLNGATADVCGTFANNIDLSGLKLRDLPKRFHLEKLPIPDSIRVVAYDASGRLVTLPSFQYDQTTNDIVFDTAPQAGIIIQISYDPR